MSREEVEKEIEKYKKELEQVKDKSNIRISILNTLYYHSLHKEYISYTHLLYSFEIHGNSSNFRYHLKKLVEFGFITKIKRKVKEAKQISSFYCLSKKGNSFLDLFQIGIRKSNDYIFLSHPSIFIDIALLEIPLMIGNKPIRKEVFKETQLKINQLTDKRDDLNG